MSEKKPLNIGLVGYGFMGRTHTNGYKRVNDFFPDLGHRPVLKAICARNEERRAAFAEQWGFESTESDWRELVKRDGVEMKYYDVIYHLTEEIAKEMAGELGPERIENVVGRAAVKEVFRSGKKDKAAGLLVEEGVIRKGLHARLTREDVIVSATTIASLRRFKDDVDEVRAGLECGVVLADTNDIKAGDQLEVFEVELRERTL